MAAERLTRADIGAWVLKCNPTVWDIEAYVASGAGPILDWSVGNTYRNQLMENGDPVILWVSGPSGGVQGVGDVTGPVAPQVLTEQGVWREPVIGREFLFASVSIDVWSQPIARADVRADPALADAEVFRSPQGTNPSYLTPAQWTTLRDRWDLPNTVADA